MRCFLPTVVARSVQWACRPRGPARRTRPPSSSRGSGRCSSSTATSAIRPGQSRPRGACGWTAARPCCGAVRAGRRSCPESPTTVCSVKALSHEGEVAEMPPDEKLPDRVLADFRRWIASGCTRPAQGEPAATRSRPAPMSRQARDSWAFRPPRSPAIPSVRDTSWPRDDLDRFILARLEAKGLRPAPDADRYTWLRRVSSRPDRPAALARGDRRVPQRPVAPGQGARRRSAAGITRVRRALGQALAGPDGLCRPDRHGQRHLRRARLEISRLRHRRVQRRQAVRPVHPRAIAGDLLPYGNVGGTGPEPDRHRLPRSGRPARSSRPTRPSCAST